MRTTYMTAGKWAAIAEGMTDAAIASRIVELEATPRALVMTDEGTHSKPATHHVWEEITGERYATRQFGGANATRLESVQEAMDLTHGRMRDLNDNQASIAHARAELKALREESRSRSRAQRKA